MTVTLQRRTAVGLVAVAAVAAAAVTALGSGTARAGAWLALTGVTATVVGVAAGRRTPVIGGLLALAAQHLVRVAGLGSVDARAAVLSGLFVVIVQAADWGIEVGTTGFAAPAVVIRRGLATVGWGIGAWLAAMVVWAVARGAVDPVPARAVAVGLLVVVWLVVVEVLRRGDVG